MGTYEEYIEKSKNLFEYIDGKFSVASERQESFRKEYNQILYEVSCNGGYPDGTSKDTSIDPVSAGYMFVVERNSFNQSDLKTVKGFFDGINIELTDSGNVYIGNLAALKSQCRFVIITLNRKNIAKILLINELFYKTPPIYVMTSSPDGKLVYLNNDSQIKVNRNSQSIKKENTLRKTVVDVKPNPARNDSFDNYDLPTTGWDSLN